MIEHILDGTEQSEPTAQAIIEAMYAASAADGDASDDEMAYVRATIERHPVFSRFGSNVRTRLLRQSVRVVDQAESPADHAAAIARALPSRLDRVVAFTMAAGVCGVDEHTSEGEKLFLHALQKALGLSDADAAPILRNDVEEDTVRTIHEQLIRLRRVLPATLECMALVASADGRVTDEEILAMTGTVRRIRDVSSVASADLGDLVRVAFERIEGRTTEQVLRDVAAQITQTADRHWIIVYMLVALQADGFEDWRESTVLAHAKDYFGVENRVIEASSVTAKQLLAETMRISLA